MPVFQGPAASADIFHSLSTTKRHIQSAVGRMLAGPRPLKKIFTLFDEQGHLVLPEDAKMDGVKQYSIQSYGPLDPVSLLAKGPNYAIIKKSTEAPFELVHLADVNSAIALDESNLSSTFILRNNDFSISDTRPLTIKQHQAIFKAIGAIGTTVINQKVVQTDEPRRVIAINDNKFDIPQIQMDCAIQAMPPALQRALENFQALATGETDTAGTAIKALVSTVGELPVGEQILLWDYIVQQLLVNGRTPSANLQICGLMLNLSPTTPLTLSAYTQLTEIVKDCTGSGTLKQFASALNIDSNQIEDQACALTGAADGMQLTNICIIPLKTTIATKNGYRDLAAHARGAELQALALAKANTESTDKEPAQNSRLVENVHEAETSGQSLSITENH